jgi:hypothetical protein
LRKTPIFSPKIVENRDHNIDPWSQALENSHSESTKRTSFSAQVNFQASNSITQTWTDTAENKKNGFAKRRLLESKAGCPEWAIFYHLGGCFSYIF